MYKIILFSLLDFNFFSFIMLINIDITYKIPDIKTSAHNRSTSSPTGILSIPNKHIFIIEYIINITEKIHIFLHSFLFLLTIEKISITNANKLKIKDNI